MLFGFIYLVSVFFLAEIYNQINILLSNNGYFIELGNHFIFGIEIWLFFQIISIILITICFIKKKSNK